MNIKYRIWVPQLNKMNYVEVGNNNETIKSTLCSNFKDKNGKEIYEGDILNLSFGQATVSYCRGTFCIETDEILEDYRLFDWFEVSEVVGNIFETSELLNGAT